MNSVHRSLRGSFRILHLQGVSLRSRCLPQGGGYTNPSGASLGKGTAISSREKGLTFEMTTADAVLHSRHPPKEETQKEPVCWALDEGFALSCRLCQTPPAGGHSQRPVCLVFPPSHSLGTQLQIECNILGMWTLNPHGDRHILTIPCLW